MASFASSATTCGARKHAWTNWFDQPPCLVGLILLSVKKLWPKLVVDETLVKKKFLLLQLIGNQPSLVIKKCLIISILIAFIIHLHDQLDEKSLNDEWAKKNGDQRNNNWFNKLTNDEWNQTKDKWRINKLKADKQKINQQIEDDKW